MKHKPQLQLKADALQTCVDLFLTHQAAQRSTVRTIATYRGLLAQFTTWLRERQVTEPRAITTGDVRAYFASLGERNLTAWYIHTHARTVKTWLRFLHAEGVLPADIMARVAMPKLDRKILPSFTGDDVRKLLDACEHSQNPERDKAILLALLDSGARAAELCGVDVGDVDMTTGGVHIRQGKGRKDRVTRVGHRARKALLRYFLERGDVQSDEPLFVSENDGGRMTPNGLLQLLRRIGTRAGVHCHPHKFRRTCAVTLYRAGVQLADIALLLGHSDLETLKGYLDLQAQDGLQAHERAGPVETLLGKK
jgi:site-specific recombinase XerD